MSKLVKEENLKVVGTYEKLDWDQEPDHHFTGGRGTFATRNKRVILAIWLTMCAAGFLYGMGFFTKPASGSEEELRTQLTIESNSLCSKI